MTARGEGFDDNEGLFNRSNDSRAIDFFTRIVHIPLRLPLPATRVRRAKMKRICAWLAVALLSCAGASPSAPPSTAVVAAADALTRASVAIGDAPPTLDCEACEFVLAVYVEIAGNATTLREFTELFESACGVIAPGLPVVQDVCDAVISALMSGVVPFLDEQLTTLAWDIPKVFCAVFIPVVRAEWWAYRHHP